jgi:transcriptional regulator with XRE-family HTH domain
MSSQVKPRFMLSSNRLKTLRLQLVAEEYKQRVGRRIREARKEKGWSQAQLARALPGTVDGPSISRWERGNVLPQSETLDALAAALDVDVSYFLVEEPVEGTGDLIGALKPSDQPTGLQAELAAVNAKLDRVLALLEGGQHPILSDEAANDLADLLTERANRPATKDRGKSRSA